jgi:4-carboxymuconolactone decarboxylase
MTYGSAAPRIAPVDPPYDAETEAQLQKWMPPNSSVEPLSLFRTLLVHPELAARMRPLGAALLGHGLIEGREREIVILRTCARCDAEYEWGVHAVAFGNSVGLTEQQIAATVIGTAGDTAWSHRDRLLIRLADELYETNRIADELWQELAAVWPEPALLELIVIAGWYRTLAYVINAVHIRHEPWSAHYPAR